MIDFDELVLVPCQETFAWDIVFYPKGAPSVPLKGIFSADFAAIHGNGNMVVQGRVPVLGLRQADLRAAGANQPREGDRMTVRNPFTGLCADFEVAAAEPDAEGDLQVHLVRL
jgi:hypothetical protein